MKSTKKNDEMSRIEPSTNDSTSQRSPMCVESLMPLLSVECQWLLTNVKELLIGQTVDVLFEASIFRYIEDRNIRINRKDINQLLESKKIEHIHNSGLCEVGLESLYKFYSCLQILVILLVK